MKNDLQFDKDSEVEETGPWREKRREEGDISDKKKERLRNQSSDLKGRAKKTGSKWQGLEGNKGGKYNESRTTHAQEAIRVLMVLGVLESFRCLVLYRRAEIRLGVSLELP